ncbi:MAG: glycohydrolase toxin TNT-related protein [Eubacterium sp.]|nr:glycohydrolase toxin TNT-related protein [Eubacterium sp.]
MEGLLPKWDTDRIIYNQIGQATTILQTQQSIQVLSGQAAPWFCQIGGGTQYLILDGTVEELILKGIIAIFEG